ncbi:MAG: hypothetical protein JWM78_2406 [Verrucomicrobiaceae bacterium]|nr:hypothetical protein [Verrucomicrobiaceae bacterium]
MAIDVRNIPALPVTQLDRAPKPDSRVEPNSVPVTKLRFEAPRSERRRNPDRRDRRKGKGPMDRRLGADRRRNAIDIEV